MTTTIVMGLAAGIVLLVAGVLFARRAMRKRAAEGPARLARGEATAEQDVPLRYSSSLLGTAISLSPVGFPIELHSRGTPSTWVDRANLRDCTLLFNNRELARSTGDGAPATAAALDALRTRMHKEHMTRLGSTSERRIDIVLDWQLDKPRKHTLNFYYRAGSNRVTPHSYDESVEAALDMYWQLSMLLHEGTLKTVPAAVEEPAAPVAGATSTAVAAATGTASQSLVGGAGGSLANELERLVALRQQDLLNDEEFRQAKARLLNG